MRIETNRSWLLIETRRAVVTIIWPWSSAASAFRCSGDRRFGWTDEGNGETWFRLGGLVATLERKREGASLGAMLADCGGASAA